MDAWTYEGHAGQVAARVWRVDHPRYAAVLVHGYGEHIGRYEWVAATLGAHGAVVYGLDHAGHGESEGERVLVRDYDDVVADLHQLVSTARADHPDVPLVMIGHSMGGLIATRYAQLHAEELTALVLSGPVIGSWAVVDELLAQDPIPPTPIDPATLSRDPEIGRIYAEDPLVWHGDFRRETLEALNEAMARISAHGSLGDLPLLYLHGEEDRLVPIGPSREGVAEIAGPATESGTYPGAQHEIFNETNKEEVLADVTAFVDRVLEA
ncbi:lysophospholipase [Georgenia sp. Z1344]|uniref:alpha/beta hydrolase n=1 Tax=Georgenia sp. Z1344 TaxID=3416706 RepID=UPI003CF26B21